MTENDLANNELALDELSRSELLKKLNRKLIEWLNPKVNTALEQASENFLKYANNSKKYYEQSRYLEFIQILDKNRNNISTSFLKGIRKGWLKQKKSTTEEINIDFDSLTILSKEELEQTVALEAVANSVKTKCGANLGILLKRCNALGIAKPNEEIPYHPQFICESFDNAISKIQAEGHIKVTLISNFNRYLLTLLDKLYDEINSFLLKEGVLPELKLKNKVQSVKTSLTTLLEEKYKGNKDLISGSFGDFKAVLNSIPVANSKKENKNADPSSNTPVVVGTPQNIGDRNHITGPSASVNNLHQSGSATAFTAVDFAQIRGLLRANSGNIINLFDADNSSIETSQNESNSAQPTELISVLNHLQGKNKASQKTGIGTAISLGDIQLAVQERLSNKRVNQVDSDALNLVFMLFEFILDDPQLSVHMKSLLGRLQIPILKVAIIDHDFFSNSKHPARKLLNGLARAGQAWNPTEDIKKDKYYQVIAKVVRKVVINFKDDITIFEPLNQTISKLLKQQKILQSRAKERIRQEEENKVKLEFAESQAKEVLEQLSIHQDLPNFLVQFLNNNWSKVIAHTVLEDNEKEYTEALEIIDNLMWSIEPNQMQNNREEFLNAVPKALKLLRERAKEFEFDDLDMAVLFDNLEATHLGHKKKSSEHKPYHNSQNSKVIDFQNSANERLSEDNRTNSINPDPQNVIHLRSKSNIKPIKANQDSIVEENPIVEESTKLDSTTRNTNKTDITRGDESTIEVQEITDEASIKEVLDLVDKLAEEYDENSKLVIGDNQEFTIENQSSLSTIVEPFSESKALHVTKPEQKDLHANNQSAVATAANLSQESIDENSFKLKPSATTRGQSNSSTLETENSSDQKIADQKYYDYIDNLEIGMLFEYKNVNGEAKRCNLAITMPSVNKYIFLDRHGIRVAKLHRDELAYAFSDGSMQRLDDSLLFDRALEAVIGSLRKKQ